MLSLSLSIHTTSNVNGGMLNNTIQTFKLAPSSTVIYHWRPQAPTQTSGVRWVETQTHTHTHTANCDHTCACNFHRSKLFEKADVDVGGRVKHGTQRCHGRKPDLPPGHRCEEKNLMRYAAVATVASCEAMGIPNSHVPSLRRLNRQSCPPPCSQGSG